MSGQNEFPGNAADTNALLEILFDYNPFPVWICDSRCSSFVAVNNSALKSYGYSRDEFLRLKVHEVWAESEFERWKTSLRSGKKGTHAWGSFTHVAKSGKKYSAEIESTQCTFAGRNAVAVILRIQNSDAPLLQVLRESEDRFRKLFDEAPVGYHEIDGEGRIVSVNRTELDLLGYDSQEMIGHFVWEFTVDPDASRIAVGKKLAGEQPAGRSYERDFVKKDGTRIHLLVEDRFLNADGDKIAGIRTTLQDMSYRKEMEDALKRSEEQFRSFFEEDATADALTSVEGAISECNSSFVRMFGFKSREEAVATNIGVLYPSPEHRAKLLQLLAEKKKLTEYEVELRRMDGTALFVRANYAGVFDDSGKLVKLRQYLIDETERKSLERQLMQAQKLEGIGRLAGGVAHDYNNILGVILGYAELASGKLAKDDPLLHDVQSILTAANRGAELTRQLLAFARREIVSPKVLNLNAAIESIKEMLQRLIGENITLVVRTQEDLWNCKIDPTQFDQILINLSSNSRDAVDDVGTITIETMNARIEERYVLGHHDFLVGEYVVVSFSDDGRGMDRETQEKIFEPFFTTKRKGEGTGLGLSTIYGIVKQNGGNINVYSEPGKGTTIRIYLPRSYSREEAAREIPQPEDVSGTETVLVVEDQADLLELAKKSLEEFGYKVITAWTPGEAIILCEAYPQKIDVLLTDVIMPVMNGRELRDRIINSRPTIKTLFMSGYTANVIAHRGILDEGIEFIQKPFTPRALAKAVRGVLHR